MSDHLFIDSKLVLEQNAANTFESLWSLNLPWFEAPNIRRGGWSGVVKHSLPTHDGETKVFIKRQENHISKTWCHPISGIPTFQKEYLNIKRMTAAQLPTLDLVFFGVEKKRAILITKELEGFCSFEDVDRSQLTGQDRRQLLSAMAKVIAKMHQQRLQHNALYPKHVFVKKSDDSWQISIIDLEKMKRTLTSRAAMLRDLSTLDRHSGSAWSMKDRITFMQAYFAEAKLSAKSRKICQTLLNKDKHKRR